MVPASDAPVPRTVQRYLDEVRLTLPKPAFGPRIIYTTLFGRSDNLKQPAKPQPGWDLICLTDRRDLVFGSWKPVFIDMLHYDARRTARVFKILPWTVFPEAKESIFLDGSIRITGSVDEFLKRHCAGADLSCFVHPNRSCTYAEAEECLKRSMDRPELILTQMDDYRQQGFPDGGGLIASGVLVRRHESEAVRALMVRWANEVERYSVRDQLSFSFSAWVTGTAYNPVPLDIFDNPYFEVHPHVRLQRFDAEGRDVATLPEKAEYWILRAKSFARRVLRRLLKLFHTPRARSRSR